MIGKTQAARQPSIDELLASIRQAIHDRVGPTAHAHPPSVLHPKPPARPEVGATIATTVRRLERAPRNNEALQTAADGSCMKRTIVKTGQEGFAGLLGGDVRLEEALARLNQNGWRHGVEASNVTDAGDDAAVAAMPARPELRPTIDPWTGARASPVAPAPVVAAPLALQPLRQAPLRQAPLQAPVEEGPVRKAASAPPPAIDHHGDTSSPPNRSAHTSAQPGPGDLLSSEAASAANSAFNRLADAMAGRSSGASTLDEVSREMLRPLLKVWLDENLPGLVERLVREEIARVARPGK